MLTRTDEVLENNCLVIEMLDNIVLYFRQQNFDKGIRKFEILINKLEKLIANYDLVITKLDNYDTNNNEETLLNILNNILQTQENRDYVLLSDLLELQLRPFVIKIQEWIITELDYNLLNINEEKNLQAIMKTDKDLYLQSQMEFNGEVELQCEYTASGFPTVKCFFEGKEFYFHSNNNPQLEAAIMAATWYSDDKHKYIVYGLGLGYHICQLCEIDSYIEIDVYESNLTMLQLAIVYGVLERCLLSGQVRVHYDPEHTKLATKLTEVDEDTEFAIHEPSLRIIEEANIRDRMEEYFLHYQSVKNQKGILKGNFRYNVHNYDSYVDELFPLWKDKDIYIIAAGPSLDLNYNMLKNIGENGVILATGTVYRKLMAAGIRPDYVILSDGNARVISQIAGLENETIPMLILSSAYKEFAKRYQGKKYLICQEGFSMAEEFAKEKGYRVYKTGGSVSTTALDVAISLGAKRIMFVGLDLAYPNNLVHAEGTSRRHLADDNDLKTVKDVNGDLVKTNKHLDVYRRWIEERIRTTSNGVEFIDATEGGAYINGTKLMRLEDVVNKYYS